jgi:hypothetical protein
MTSIRTRQVMLPFPFFLTFVSNHVRRSLIWPFLLVDEISGKTFFFSLLPLYSSPASNIIGHSLIFLAAFYLSLLITLIPNLFDGLSSFFFVYIWDYLFLVLFLVNVKSVDSLNYSLTVHTRLLFEVSTSRWMGKKPRQQTNFCHVFFRRG